MEVWNLSALPFRQTQVVLDQLDPSRLLKIFGLDPTRLTQLTLSNNHLSGLSAPWDFDPRLMTSDHLPASSIVPKLGNT